MRLQIIAAMDENRGIGKNNAMPWYLPEDLAHFKATTLNHHIIMGRKTFESLGSRPLPKRNNIVLTRNLNWSHSGVTTVYSLDAALEHADGQLAFVIGGAEIYKQALPLAEKLILTLIHRRYECDTFFPAIQSVDWELSAQGERTISVSGPQFTIQEYNRLQRI
jgi:dihydrofolate reductase